MHPRKTYSVVQSDQKTVLTARANKDFLPSTRFHTMHTNALSACLLPRCSVTDKKTNTRVASFFFAQQIKGLLMIGGMRRAFALFACVILAVVILLIVAKNRSRKSSAGEGSGFRSDGGGFSAGGFSAGGGASGSW